MSFLPAVQREIGNRQQNDPVRLTLEYLMQNGIGRENAKSLETIVGHLQDQGINISTNGFQQTVLAESRNGDFFIGSGRHGYFLIDTIDDAEEMKYFYEARIRAEQHHLDNLMRQSAAVGWYI